MPSDMHNRAVKTMIDITGLADHVELAPAVLAPVYAALTGPTRHYHDLTHVLEMWTWYQDELSSTCTAADHRIVASAILFHDAVYNATAKPGENEQQSCDLWLANARHLPYCDQVARIILATADHVAHRGESRLSDLVLDLDLRRMAVPLEEFLRHNEALRAEYHHLSDAAWRDGSSAFLLSLYQQPKVFFTEAMQPLFLDAQVRANIRGIHRLWGKALV